VEPDLAFSSLFVTATDRFEQLKIPYHVLADAMEMGIKVMGNSYLTTRSFRDQNKDVVLRTVRALVQGGVGLRNR